MRPIDMRLLDSIIRHLLCESLKLEEFDLTVHLVGESAMARLNKLYLNHAGSTDVITLDYADGPLPMLTGEIFVCVDEALVQARRFRTAWQSELVRYIVHGVLHLQGYDDLKTVARRAMKREEGRRLRELAREFDLRKLERKPKVSA